MPAVAFFVASVALFGFCAPPMLVRSRSSSGRLSLSSFSKIAPKNDTAFLAPLFRIGSGAISRAREERAERNQDEAVGAFVLAAASLLGGKKGDFQEEVDEGDEDKELEEAKKGSAGGEGRENELLAVAILSSSLLSSMLARADPADVDRMTVHASPTTLRYGTSTQYEEERE
jgi:hypothetical protein